MQIDKQPYPFICKTILDGTKLDITTTPSTLSATSVPTLGIEVTAASDNSDVIYIGNSTSQNRKLAAGDAIYLAIDDLNKIHLRSESGTQACSYLGLY